MSAIMERFHKADNAIITFMEKYSITLLRLALGIVFIWFGALKILGISPVQELVEKTVYFFPPEFFVPSLGLWELAIGIGLLLRLFLRGILFLFFLQMLGTSFVLVFHPEFTFQNGNPLLLTQTGEFVIKNLVLLAAGIVVGSTVRRLHVQGKQAIWRRHV